MVSIAQAPSDAAIGQLACVCVRVNMEVISHTVSLGHYLQVGCADNCDCIGHGIIVINHLKFLHSLMVVH